MSDNQIIPAAQVLPNKLTLVPLRGKPLFPGIFTPMVIPPRRTRSWWRRCLAGDGHLGFVLTRSAEDEQPTASDLFEVGTAARILKKLNLPDGGVNIFISTISRFRIKKVLHASSPSSPRWSTCGTSTTRGTRSSPSPAPSSAR